MEEKRFIISIKSDGEKTTVENRFEIDGKEATFADISFNEKYIVCEALKGSLGALANILLVEMKQRKEESDNNNQE